MPIKRPKPKTSVMAAVNPYYARFPVPVRLRTTVGVALRIILREFAATPGGWQQRDAAETIRTGTLFTYRRPERIPESTPREQRLRGGCGEAARRYQEQHGGQVFSGWHIFRLEVEDAGEHHGTWVWEHEWVVTEAGLLVDPHHGHRGVPAGWAYYGRVLDNQVLSPIVIDPVQLPAD